MRIAVIGASGFVGTYLSKHLLEAGCEVIGTRSDLSGQEKQEPGMTWKELNWKTLDSYPNLREYLQNPDRVILLAWEGLPSFNEDFHLTKNLPYALLLCHRLAHDGISHVTITGTCLEYGMTEGALHPDSETQPVTKYGLAKDILRKHLLGEGLFPFFQWFRIFYIYGEGQTPRSLFPQLMDAIHNKKDEFRMSKGDQGRDFIPIEEAVKQMSSLLVHSEPGIYNIGSGDSQTVLEFVNTLFHKHGHHAKLVLGHYPYPDYEPFNFWADISNH